MSDNAEEQYGAMLTDNNIGKLTAEHPKINIGEDAFPNLNSAEYMAELSAGFSNWNFQTQGYLRQVFADPNKTSGLIQLANRNRWAPDEGWGEWIENQANNSDVARMMRTHSKIIIGHNIVGGNIDVRTMIQSDLDRILFFDKFLRMHLDWNTYGYTIAEPVFSKKDPEREKILALQRVYKTKPTANETSGKITFRQPAGVEPTMSVPYASTTASPTFTNAGMDKSDYDARNPYPWIETQNALPIEKEDTKNDDINVNWEWHIVDLLILNPMSVRICRNNLEDVQYLRSKFGNSKNTEFASYVNSDFCNVGNGAYIIAYVQYPFNEEGQESILFYPHELIFIPRYASHSYPNGVSQLREAYKEIVLREILEELMISSAKRWGDPILKFTVNQTIWQKKELVRNMLNQIKQSRAAGMDFVTPEGVDSSIVESSGGLNIVDGPLEYVNNKLNKIMQWADSFTESDSSNRSLGETQLSFMEIDAEPERKLFASVFYKCIFLPLVVANGYNESDCPVMTFDPINPKDKIEWGNFYSGLIDQMDSGQLNTFFEFIDLPYTEPITESPMEHEKRIEEEERAEAQRDEERGFDTERTPFGERDNLEIDTFDSSTDELGRGIRPETVQQRTYPSPFESNKNSLSSNLENVNEDENGRDNIESTSVSAGDEEENGAQLSAHNIKMGKSERLNTSIARKGLKDATNTRFAAFRKQLGQL